MIDGDECPSEWNMMDFGEITENSKYGCNPDETGENINGVPFLRITDLEENVGKVEELPQKARFTDESNKDKYLLKDGDLVIARSGSIGQSYVYESDDGEMVYASYLIKFELDETKVTKEFIKLYMQSPSYWKQVNEAGRGGTQQNINAKQIKDFDIPVPPLEEQERIVREIEERLDTITTLEHSINNIQQLSNEYEDSFLAALVTGIPNDESVSSFISEEAIPENWNVKPLSSIANINPRLSLEERESYSYVPMDAVGASSQSIERFETRDDLYSGLAKFENGDIIVARITPCFENGKMSIVNNIPSEYSIAVGSSEFVVIRPEEINREYLFTYLKSPIVKQWGENRLIGTTNRERIQISQFRNELFVPVPPKEKQKEIVNKYNTTDFNEIKQSVDALDMFFEEYKESVLSDAFSGHI